MTWSEIVKIAPELEELLTFAGWVSDPGGPHFCANRIWYGLFKPRLLEMVGWESKIEMLGTTEAYDLAYEKIYAALPHCRDCGCM